MIVGMFKSSHSRDGRQDSENEGLDDWDVAQDQIGMINWITGTVC